MTEKIYHNRATCRRASLTNSKAGNPMLRLEFAWETGVDDDYKPIMSTGTFFQVLSADKNERVRALLERLGCSDIPEEVTPSAVRAGLTGLGTRTVDLVCEPDEKYGERIAFVNEPRWGVKVYDNTK